MTALEQAVFSAALLFDEAVAYEGDHAEAQRILHEAIVAWRAEQPTLTRRTTSSAHFRAVSVELSKGKSGGREGEGGAE